MATALGYISECPVCLEAYEDPKALPCDHTLCANCVEEVRRGSRIKCPICNATHDVEKVRADFRIAQFIDALKESQPQKQRTAKTDGGVKCEICYKQPVAYGCEECEQWMCKDCKIHHTRTKYSKTHKLLPITQKCDQIKDIFSAKSSTIKRNIKKQKRSIDKTHAEICRLQIEQTNALQASDNLRQQSLTAVKDYFDTLDARIIEVIYIHMARLEAQKRQLTRKLNDISIKYERLEQMVIDSASQLAMEGMSLLSDVEVLSTAACKVDITEVEITVLQGRAWDASTAAVLALKGGLIDGGLADTRPQPNADAPLQLFQLSGKKFTRRTEVGLASYPNTLRMFSDELWVCQFGGTINIFNCELQKLRTLANANWAGVCDVTQVNDGELIIADKNGLFHTSQKGKTLSKINSSSFTSVVFYDNKVYAHATEPSRVLVYKYNTTWKTLKTLKLPFVTGAFITLALTHNAINACSDADGKILVISLTGEVRNTFGGGKIGSVDYINYARLCHSDEDGSLLIADTCNGKIKVVDKRGTWVVVHMQPFVNGPVGAVYTHNKLYVVASGDNNLALYTIK